MRVKPNINWCIPGLKKGSIRAQIENYIMAKIRAGEIRPGQVLPGYRTVAAINKIHANTVRLAYLNLANDEWLDQRPGYGTLVADKLSLHHRGSLGGVFMEEFPGKIAKANQVLKILAPVYPNDFIQLYEGMILFEWFTDEDYQAFRKEDQKKMLKNEGLTEPVDQDNGLLKAALLEHMIIKRAFDLTERQMNVYMGREVSLARTLQLLLESGDEVILAAPQDFLVKNILTGIGARVHEIVFTDEDDFKQQIEKLLKLHAIKVLYIRPHCAYPCGYSFSESLCSHLIDLAKNHHFIIVEEDDDHEFSYEKPKHKPLASYRHDGHVIYLGGLSRLSAYMRAMQVVCASAQFIAALNSLPPPEFEGRNFYKERYIIELIENNRLTEAGRLACARARENRDALAFVLCNYLQEHIRFSIPHCGLYYWLELVSETEAALLFKILRQIDFPLAGLNRDSFTGKTVKYIRMGFGNIDIGHFETMAKKLTRILKAIC